MFGSTPAMVCLVGVGMVGLAAVGFVRHPGPGPGLLGAAAFFALCGFVGVDGARSARHAAASAFAVCRAATALAGPARACCPPRKVWRC